MEDTGFTSNINKADADENIVGNTQNLDASSAANSPSKTPSNILPMGMKTTSEATTSPTTTNVIISNDDHHSVEDHHLVDDVSDLQEDSKNEIHGAPTTSIQSQPGVKFDQIDELQASFTGVSNKNTDPISMILPSTKENEKDDISDVNNSSSNVINGIIGIFNQKSDSSTQTKDETVEKNLPIKTSPLLSSTPPTVSKSLIKSYSFLILLLKFLNILTWNTDSSHLSILLVLVTTFSILYYKTLIIYFGHLLPVLSLYIYSECKNYIKNEKSNKATLDDVIQTMSLICQRSEILIAPIVELDLTAGDLKRLLFTTVFLSPVYVIISFFVLPPNKMMLVLNILVLTYHSRWSKITRSLLWKSRSFRLLCFYLTGLDFENSGLSRSSTLFNLNKRLSARFNKNNPDNDQSINLFNNSSASSNKNSVRFTYVIYENQRRWLGVGWTSNLLSYERTPWTDEFLNESESIDSYELPQLPLSIDLQDDNKSSTIDGINTRGMVWRWMDKTWRLDLTNDGSIQLPSTKPKTSANPRNDDGWIYYDNTWKNPSTDDGFSKYTRRRRWIRTAELFYVNSSESNSKGESNNNIENVKIKNVSNDINRAKTARFSSADSIVTIEDADYKGDKATISQRERDSQTQSNDKSSNEKVSDLETLDDNGDLDKSPKGAIKKRKSLRFVDPDVHEADVKP